jgi:ABC-type arginine transport system permease subunit
MQKPRTRKWWLCYGTLVFGIPFFVVMTVFWGIVLFVVTSLLERRLDWRFYADPQTHAAGLLAFSLVFSLLGGCYWGFHMWKFYESKRRHPETEIKS